MCIPSTEPILLNALLRTHTAFCSSEELMDAFAQRYPFYTLPFLCLLSTSATIVAHILRFFAIFLNLLFP